MDKDWLIIIVGGLEILMGAYVIRTAVKLYDKKTAETLEKMKKAESN